MEWEKQVAGLGHGIAAWKHNTTQQTTAEVKQRAGITTNGPNGHNAIIKERGEKGWEMIMDYKEG